MGEIPHAEHPCPQAMRKNWLCLNGKWSFCKIDANGEPAFEGEILVPFSPESLLSGVGEKFRLKSGETLLYERTVLFDRAFLLGVTLLHFGAVDYECEVYINGEKAGGHRGGYTPFAVDISPFARMGENEIKIVCTDEGTRNGGARGKQSDKHGGIWYTPQSGIWQTVWLESMPKRHIEPFKIFTDAAAKTVKITHLPPPSEEFELETDSPENEITVFDNGVEILRAKYRDEIVFSYDFELWSPEHPKLYDFIITNAAGDEVRSYFGVRTFGKMRDKKGRARLTLNGKPYFFHGILDQGYWSDGMLTYPSDQAALDELTLLKRMGFNTVRKHIKLEPMRWYYHCDRLGLIVWQDFVNGGGKYKFSHIALLPFLGFKHRDDDYKFFSRESAVERAEFYVTADETVNALFNCVCIALWTPFNEGWGQFDSEAVAEHVSKKDPTRLIDSVSGWHDQGKKKTTFKSMHTYYTRLKVPRDPRPVVLSEFGGYSLKCVGHVFNESKEFGYKTFDTANELAQALQKLYIEKLLPLIGRGLCAAIYTQVSDVEEEINGLVTYDRKILKVPIELMSSISVALKTAADKIE
ncbi:MAG: glycoside hydrolase family 2 [Clostridia bacterium]|nr:glycoside hydrolase family 2 [Clostridia bacterium]